MFTITYSPHRIMETGKILTLQPGEIREVFSPHRIENTDYFNYWQPHQSTLDSFNYYQPMEYTWDPLCHDFVGRPTVPAFLNY